MKNVLAFAFIILTGIIFVTPGFSQGPGNLDATFATSGELGDSAIFPFVYSGMALSPGGEVVISSASGSEVQAIRFTSAGLRDINFGLNSSGLTKVTRTGFSGSVTSSVVQTDRKVLIAGQYTLTGQSNEAYLLRLNANGTADSSFGTNGWLLFNFLPAFGECIHQVSLQNDGKIVVLDMGLNPGNTDTFIVARINTNGSFDNTYGVNGIYQIPFNSFLYTSPNVFTINANNSLTFAGYSNYKASDYIYSFRLTQNGVIDATYGQNGSILIDSTNIINGGANLGLCFQNDGKLLTVQSKLTGSVLWAVCRYNTDGSIDQNFGTNGLVNVLPSLDPLPFVVANIAVTSTDEIIVAGVVTEAGSNRTIVCSFNADGSANTSFGNNAGSELLNCEELDDIVYNLLIDPDNEILVNGLINEANNQRYEVVKLTAPSPTTGIKQVDGSTDFCVYPNPASTQVYFKLPLNGNGQIAVNDITGKTVMVQQANGNTVQTLNLNNLAAGAYVITYKDNETFISGKVLKQ